MGKQIKGWTPPDDAVEFTPPTDAIEFTPPEDAETDDTFDSLLQIAKNSHPLAGPIINTLEGVGKAIYSGFTDTLPQTAAQTNEVLLSTLRPTNVDEHIRKNKQIDFQRYVREKDPKYSGVSGFFTGFDLEEALPKYGKSFMEDQGLGQKVTEMEEALPKVIERRQALESYVSQQKSEAQQKLKEVVQDYRDIQSVDDLGSYIGSLAGQAAYQIPLSIATRGGSSFLMEAATVYDKQLDRLAEQNGISREQVIDKNLDSPVLGQTYAILAAGLDAASAGNLVGAFRKNGGSLLKKYLLNVVPESVTEAAQGVLEDVGSGGTVEDALTGEGLAARFNELAGGAIGGSIFSFSGKSEQKKVADQMINENDAGSALNSIIDAEATLTPAEEETLKTKQAEVRLEEVTESEQKLIKEEEKITNDAIKESDQIQEENSKPKEEQKEPENKEYQEAVDKVTDLQRKFSELGINDNTEELYGELLSARTALRKIAPETTPNSKKTAIQKTIEKTTGIAKQEPITINNPAKALKEQIQTHYKLVEEGIRKGQKLTNETLIPKVQEAIKNFPLSTEQVSSILTKVKKTNLFTSGSLNKLNTFIDRVTSDADYAENLSQARGINKQLRRLGKSSGNIASIKSLAKAFAKIDPEETFINQHLEKGNQLVNALTSPIKDKYSAVNQEEIETYIDDLNNKIEENQTEEIEKVATDTEEQLGKLRTMVMFAKEDLNQKDLSDFDDSDKKTIEALKGLDVNRLEKDQLVTAIRVIDNIVTNDDLTGKGEIEAIANAQKILDNLKQKTQGKTLADIGTYAKVNANIPQLFRRIFEDSKLAAIIRGELGIQDLFAGGSRVELKENQRITDFKKVAKEFKNETGNNIRDYNNEALLGAFSQLVRRPVGGEVDIEKVKRNIERTAKEYLRAEETEAAEAWQKAYNTFQGVNSVEEVFEVMPKPLLKVWDFFKNTFQTDTNEQLRKVTEEQYNSKYVEEENYTHSGLTNLNDVSGQRDKLLDGEQQGKGRIKAKQSKTSLTATRNLPGGWAYNIDWIGTQFKALHESLYDIETAKTKMQLQHVLYSSEFEGIVGGTKNAKILRDQIFTGEQTQRGTTRVAANEAVKVVDSIARTARSLGSARVLGSVVGQVLKQVPPVLVKAVFNHVGTGSFVNFMQGLSTRMNPNIERLFQNSQIGVRGERLGGIDRGNAEFYRLAAGGKEGLKFISRNVESAFDALDNATRTSLYALTKFDTVAARRVWLGYYLQSLKEQGVGKVNLNEEYKFQQDPIRKAAVSFAEQQISETQLPSNPAELSSIARNDKNQALNILKNIVLPFANYSLNAKQRLVQDVTSLYRNPAKKNFASVAGDIAEIASFATIQVFILGVYKSLIKQGIEAMMGVEPPEKDEDKESAKEWRQFFTTIFNGLTPTAIGTVGELGTDRVINGISYLVQNPDKNFQQWKKDTGGFLYEDKEFDWGLLTLGAEAPIEAVSNSFDLGKSLTGEPIVIKDFIGNTKEIQLNEDQQRVLILKTLIEWSSAVGYNEADIYNQIRKVYKEQLRKPNEKRSPRHRERIRN